MCRIAGFIGPRLSLADFICTPTHGLAHQSWAAREMVSATTNADGWGAAWLDAEARPANYRQILPIWADVNLEPLGRSLESTLWLGNVRSATAGLGTDFANTQPFVGGKLLFTHNGFIEDFAHSLRATIRAAIDPMIEREINGNTDSEYLFALLRSQPGDLAERLRRVHGLLHDWLDDLPGARALLNMIVSDGETLVASRDAVNDAAPSLYINADWCGGVAISSEAMDDHAGWQRVESQNLITVRAGQPPAREPL